jgi:hypothetical protein
MMIEELAGENRRLSEEIVLREEESAILRGEFGGDKVNGPRDFEVKLATLAEENLRLNTQVNSYRSEIEKLGEQLLHQTHETERARVKRNSTDSNGDLFALEDHIINIQKENERVVKTNKSYLKEIDLWRNKCFTLEQSQSRLAELEAKIDILAHENENMQKFLKDKIQEVESWKQKCNSIEHLSNSRLLEVESRFTMVEGENLRLEAQLKEKELEITRLSEMKSNLESKIFNREDLRPLVEELRSENESLKVTLDRKIKDIEILQSRITNLQQEVNGLTRYLHEIDSLKRDLTKTQIDLEAKNKAYETAKTKAFELDILRPRVLELESRLALVTTENERSLQLANEREKEAENLRRKGEKVTDMEAKMVLMMAEIESLGLLRNKIE